MPGSSRWTSAPSERKSRSPPCGDLEGGGSGRGHARAVLYRAPHGSGRRRTLRLAAGRRRRASPCRGGRACRRRSTGYDQLSRSLRRDLQLALLLVAGRRRLDQHHQAVLVAEVDVAVGVGDRRRAAPVVADVAAPLDLAGGELDADRAARCGGRGRRRCGRRPARSRRGGSGRCGRRGSRPRSRSPCRRAGRRQLQQRAAGLVAASRRRRSRPARSASGCWRRRWRPGCSPRGTRRPRRGRRPGRGRGAGRTASRRAPFEITIDE